MMRVKATRLEKEEEKYENEMQNWLTNPKNEDLSDEVVEQKLADAFDRYVQALLLNERECAEFIAAGGRMGEPEILEIIFEHFKSREIFEAIKQNCELAFSHRLFVESQAIEEKRRILLSYIEANLGVK